MSDFEKRKLEMDLRSFTTKNFERPSDCRDINQIRFYVNELCIKIDDYERRFNFVPSWAYSLLSQYNTAQNQMIDRNFRKAYC
jgi:hypothetical protein